MTKRHGETIRAELLEVPVLGMAELARCCNLEHTHILEMIEIGLLDPAGATPAEWRFAEQDLRRARAAARLTRDLDVNLAGAAIILDLLEQRTRMLERIRTLEHLLD